MPECDWRGSKANAACSSTMGRRRGRGVSRVTRSCDLAWREAEPRRCGAIYARALRKPVASGKRPPRSWICCCTAATCISLVQIIGTSPSSESLSSRDGAAAALRPLRTGCGGPPAASLRGSARRGEPSAIPSALVVGVCADARRPLSGRLRARPQPGGTATAGAGGGQCCAAWRRRPLNGRGDAKRVICTALYPLRALR